MIYQTLKVAIVVAVLAVCGSVSAQPSGGCGAPSEAQPYGFAGRSCGRSITQQYAASLWAGYCNENCEYRGGESTDGCCNSCGSRSCGGGCKLGGKLRGRMGKRGG